MSTANLRTKILDFRGFVSSRILTLRSGTLRSIGDFLETLSQRILAWRTLAWRLALKACLLSDASGARLLHLRLLDQWRSAELWRSDRDRLRHKKQLGYKHIMLSSFSPFDCPVMTFLEMSYHARRRVAGFRERTRVLRLRQNVMT